MNDYLKKTILRFAVVFITILLLFVIVGIRIVKIQTVERDKWLGIASQRDKYKGKIKATRGNIYDCNGKILATSVPQYNIHMDTRVEALHLNNGELFWGYVDSIAEGLSRIIGDQTKEEYRTRMVNAYNGKSQSECDICLSRERISDKQLKEIKQLPLVRRGVYKSGIYEVGLNVRYKPYNSLASRTVGSLSVKDGVAQSGLEKKFDSYLCGKDGVSARQFVAGAWQFFPVQEAENGYDVYTTFDVELMDICETVLRKRLEFRGAEWGCVILMDVQTGEIKSMNNLKRGEDGNYYEVENFAVRHSDPGSTFKTISMMAALDDGKLGEHDRIKVQKGTWYYKTLPHRDSHAMDTVLTPRSALAASSNIAIAKIVTESYNGDVNLFYDKLRTMGLGDNIDYTLPEAQQIWLNLPLKGDKATIAKIAYGYSVEFSPLHILMFYNGIANNGRMIAPLFVKEIRKNNEQIERFESPVLCEKLCNETALKVIKDGLHDAVWDNKLGTASINNRRERKAQSDLISIAGKTGTAQQISPNKAYTNTQHRYSFVGYFPEENPQYTCICVISNPKPNKEYPCNSGLDCGGVVRDIAEKILIQKGEYVIRDGQKVLVFKK